MKKIFITLLLTLFSFVLIAQERELSDYEKYRMEKENELYENDDAKQDTVIIYDTIYIDADYEPMVMDNYYNDYNQPNYRFRLTFGYTYPYYPYYDYYDNWNYGYPYYPYRTHYYPYRTHYYPYYCTRYYGNYPRYGTRPRGRHYGNSSALGRNRNHYQPYNKTYRNGYVTAPNTTKKNVVVNRPVTKQTTTRVINSRTTGEKNVYRPRYNKPVSRTRAPYNNTKITRNRRTTQTKTMQSQRQQQRSNHVRRSTAPSRSYSTPSRSASRATTSRVVSRTAPSKSYSTPSRSSGSRSYNTPSRSSGASRSSGSRSSSGSSSRSSGGRR